MQPATRSPNQSLGGTSGDWRHRVLRFHVPLAVVNALVLLLFMTLPLFDMRGVGGHVDLTSGAFPQQQSRGETGPMNQGEGQTGRMAHDTRQSGVTEHNRGQTGSTEHSRDQ